jgi:hypothetical protein
MADTIHSDRINRERDPKAITNEIVNFDTLSTESGVYSEEPKPFKDIIPVVPMENHVRTFYEAEPKKHEKTLAVANNLDDFKILKEVLNIFSDPKITTPVTLTSGQRRVLSDAAKLVTLLAEERSESARNTVNDSDVLSTHFGVGRAIRTIDDGSKKNLPQNPDEMKSHILRHVECVNTMFSNEALQYFTTEKNLRNKIIPLFRELAQALRIPFNEPGQERGI